MSKPTIYTLARELGISPSTVSRALNNSPKISSDRRRTIQELARKRKFKLRDFAPRLTNLCVLICTKSGDEAIFSEYTDQVISGVHSYCCEQDLELSIFSSSREKLDRPYAVKELLRRNVDGVILVNADDDSPLILQLEEEKLPYCCLLAGHSDFPEHTLSVNNIDLAEKAVDYLIQLGHTRIAFLYSAAHNQAQLDRLAGYRNALRKNRIELDAAFYPDPPEVSSSTGIEYGFLTLSRILDQRPEITAVFASSLDLAEGARSAIFRKGLRLPSDISLIGCDDSPRADYFCPPLTVIDIPNRLLGRTAAAWLHEKIKGGRSPRPPREPWMEGRLIVRETTAPPRHH